MRHLLTEAVKKTKRVAGIDPHTPAGHRQVVSDPNAFGVYVKSLAEGLTDGEREEFTALAENTRVALMENSMFQLNPYETLSLPILRVFYPRLIAKELVNVLPIDKPEIIKGFVRASFKKSKESSFDYSFPSTTDISRGPSVGVSVTANAEAGDTDILAAAGLVGTDLGHVEKDFKITKVYYTGDTTSATADTVEPIYPDVDGNFAASVTIGSLTGVVSGKIDFLNGILYWSSTQPEFDVLEYEAFIALEENMMNPQIKYEIEKIRLTAIDRRISAEWTVNMEQDIKALFDISLQSEIANIIGEQIALDIDQEIINLLISTDSANNPSSHRDTFYKTPAAAFTWGQKLWFENVIPVLNKLSAQVYNSCLMGAANTLACNPLDAAVLESLNTFEYTGNSVEGGELGYRSATVQGGKWKILVSSIVPAGSVVMKYRSPDPARASLIYAPYVPALLMPYPLGAIPSLTIMSRYATKVVRPEAIAVLTMNEGQAPA